MQPRESGSASKESTVTSLLNPSRNRKCAQPAASMVQDTQGKALAEAHTAMFFFILKILHEGHTPAAEAASTEGQQQDTAITL
jgi:hypothetical protein